jgi:hypothetical protein
VTAILPAASAVAIAIWLPEVSPLRRRALTSDPQPTCPNLVRGDRSPDYRCHRSHRGARRGPGSLHHPAAENPESPLPLVRFWQYATSCHLSVSALTFVSDRLHLHVVQRRLHDDGKYASRVWRLEYGGE